MFCQDCPDIGSCNKICDRLKKHFKRGYDYQHELTIGREVEYDNSSIWPDDPEHIKDPDILSRQVRGVGKRKSKKLFYKGKPLQSSIDQLEDDCGEYGIGLKGKYLQGRASAEVSWAEAASNWKDWEDYEFLNQIENKVLYYLYQERLSVAKTAQRVRRSKSAVNSIKARAFKKFRLKYPKYREDKKTKRDQT